MDLARNLKVECVSRLHPKPARIVQSAQTVVEAIALMREERLGSVLVYDGDQLIGIFTERDLMRRVLAKEQSLTLPVSNFMTPDPVVVDRTESIGAAVRRMEEGGYRHLPVVHEGNPVGIISVKDIVHYLVEHFPGTVHNQPPDPKKIQKTREGA